MHVASHHRLGAGPIAEIFQSLRPTNLAASQCIRVRALSQFILIGFKAKGGRVMRLGQQSTNTPNG
jgi:hypothetical protein